MDKGSYTDGWRYMEAAPEGQVKSVWGTYGQTVPGAVGSAIGTGQQNTLDIITGDPATNTAADVCDAYSITNCGVSYEDWFLPSIGELNQIYNELCLYGEGNFSNGYHWSSTKYGGYGYEAWLQSLVNGDMGHNFRDLSIPVHAVRTF